MRIKLILSSLMVSLVAFILSANPVYAGGTCYVLCNCNDVQVGGRLGCAGLSDSATCTPNGTVKYQCDDGGGTGTIDSFRSVINGLLPGRCGDPDALAAIGCTGGLPLKCERACVPVATTNLACGPTGCSISSQCASGLCIRIGLVNECRNPACREDDTCSCGGTTQPANTCKITCDMASTPPCSSVSNLCSAGTCRGSSDDGYRALILARLSGTPASAPGCTKTGTSTYTCTDPCTTIVPPIGVTGGECKKEARSGPPAGDYWKKINCSGRCPGPSGGEPIEDLCVACREPNIDFGVCAVQPDGEIFDSCCPGSVAQRDRVGCTCQPTKDAVYRLFEAINGVMLPVVIILGIFLIVVKGYKIMTSQGDPAALQEGKEGLTSAIIGLIFVLMAVSILRVIIKALITGDTDPFS